MLDRNRTAELNTRREQEAEHSLAEIADGGIAEGGDNLPSTAVRFRSHWRTQRLTIGRLRWWLYKCQLNATVNEERTSVMGEGVEAVPPMV